MQKKILLVDDEEIIRDLLEKAFKREGYYPYIAKDADEALSLLEQANDINVMFLDLKLPGMSGIELCKLIRNENPMAITYAITGYASLTELAECRNAGFEDYFSKPVELKIIFKAAENAFEKIDRWGEK